MQDTLPFVFKGGESFLDSVGDGVIATDTSGKIILINTMAQTMLGRHPDEVMDNHFLMWCQ
ncbi:MAG: PAS domain-containing protein [Candidatus Vogelbacteria bacterium]|nr:PAS domain-containing protein [Candidatus Vogelbacteria bacterium]